MLRNALCVVVACFLTAGFAFVSEAQSAENSSWENLKLLKVDQKIEVVEVNLKSHKGTFVSYSEDGITVRVDNDSKPKEAKGSEDVTVQHPAVLRVSIIGHSHRRLRNTLIGTAAGFGCAMLSFKAMEEPQGGISDSNFDAYITSQVACLAGGPIIGNRIPVHDSPTIYRNPSPTEAP